MKINGKTLEERIKDIPEDQYIPHHTDRWYNRQERSWVVQLHINNKNERLGYFDNVDEAGKFAEKMRQKYYGEFAGLS